MTKLCFLDTETTGLDPHRHEVWEVGMILRDEDGTEQDYVWQLPVDLARADLIALSIGRFHERRWPEVVGLDNRRAACAGQWPDSLTQGRLPAEFMPAWAAQFMDLTWGAHIVGAVPDFDSRRLGELLLRHGAIPGWHYHLIDVETLAAGYLAGRHRGLASEGPQDDRAAVGRPPWKSDDLAAALGVKVSEEDRHTALGDARMARTIYDVVMADASL